MARISPVFRAAGTNAVAANNIANPTALAPGLPTRVTDDVLVLITSCRSITATVATPTGWTPATGFPKRSATASGGSFYIFFRFVDGSETAPTVSWSGVTTGTTGDSSQAIILSYEKVDISGGIGAIMDVTPPAATDAAATTSITLPSITTTLANSMAIGAALRINDTAHTFTVATWTERTDTHTTSGTGHGRVSADFTKVTAGATGTATVTPSNTTSSRALGVTIALKGKDVTPLVEQDRFRIRLPASQSGSAGNTGVNTVFV